MEIVDSLVHPENTAQRAVLNGLLMASNSSLDTIAAWMNLDEEVVFNYSNMVFNVRDRFDDHPYINRILYSNGRVYHSRKGAQIPYELRLLRIGREKGGEEVLYQAGFLCDQGEVKSAQQQLQDLELALIANAGADLRLGDTDSPALKQVRPLLAAHAENREANHGAPDDMTAGLGAVGLRGMIATVKRIQGPDIQKRLNLPSAEEIDAAKRAFSPAAG
jgi:hypothetical protein